MSAPYRGLTLRWQDLPDLHRQLWTAGTTGQDRYGRRPYGAKLSPFTRRSALKGFGRFMATCPASEQGLPPEELVIPCAVRRFIAAMERCGNCGNTIAQRLWELRMALRIMRPDLDFSWLTSPERNDVRVLFRSEPRRVRIYHPQELFRWGLELMDQALHIDRPEGRAVQYRNGLIITVLACRAPRQRSLAAIRLLVQLVREDDRFRLVFTPQDMKWKRWLEYALPGQLTGRFEQYLSVERPMLLAGRPDEDWLWLGHGGTRLTQAAISTMLWRQSLQRFGEGFGTHRFRYCIGTVGPIADAQLGGGVAALLGNSRAVLQKSYNLGQLQEAARLYHAGLRQERRELKGIALRAFGRG